jgi:regulator of sigma E protease
MSWVLALAGLCFLILVHEAGHFVAAKATGMRVERFFLFFGPRLISVKRGETEYGIASIPLGGYVKITGMNPEEDVPAEVAHRAYYRQPVWKRIVVTAAGPVVNILFAFALFFFVFFFFAQQGTQSVGEIRSGSPASRALQPGDQILAVDGKAFPGAGREARLERFGEQVASHECRGKQVDGCTAATPVQLRIRRDGVVRTISVRPEYNAEAGRALIGFSYGSRHEEVGPLTAAGRSLDTMWFVTHKTASVVSRLFESEQRKQISSVVGISSAGHEAVDAGADRSLLLLALVSLSLGLFNLLPILPLDGGHIFWSLVEKLRGRPVSLRVMERASVIGIALFAVLLFIGLSNDIGRISGEGFGVR